MNSVMKGGKVQMRKIFVEYFTDPTSAYCYAFDPVLNRLIQDHGDELHLVTRFGGSRLQEHGFLDPDNGISEPKDVAAQWEQIGEKTGIPIKGDVWLKDPITSSYPASVACFAARSFGEEKSKLFLNKVREKVFVEGKNVARDSVLLEAAEESQIPSADFLQEFYDPGATFAFIADLNDAEQRNVRIFPTLLFYEGDHVVKLEGYLPYAQYEDAIQQLTSLS